MKVSDDQGRIGVRGDAQFATTHWSAVLRVGKSLPGSDEALARLCETYWFPLYAFVRRRGYRPEEAEDLTQGFFCHLLTHRSLASVDQAKGRFRAFLIASLRHFVANEWAHARTQKRGGGQRLLSLDACGAEARYALEPPDPSSPEKAFERNWAMTLMEKVLERLRATQEARGKGTLFAALQPCLMNDADAPRHAELAAQLGMNAAAVRMEASRLRRRFRKLLYEEVERTVDTPAEVEEEIRHLFAALAN